MIVKMPGKGLEHRVGSALGVSRPGQVRVETLDGHADSPDALLGTVPAAPGVLAQEIGNLLQLTPRLGLDRLDFPLVFEHRRQLALLAPQPPDGLGVVQPEAALLNDLVRKEFTNIGAGNEKAPVNTDAFTLVDSSQTVHESGLIQTLNYELPATKSEARCVKNAPLHI